MLREATDALIAELEKLDENERITAINSVRSRIHSVSPLRGEPIDLVLWVPAESVDANDYNPNATAPPEMRLLEHSILSDGYTQPVVTWLDGNRRETIDGFHRGEVGRSSHDVRTRTLGYLPVTTISESRTDRGDRMAATIRHNRARGRHKVDGMTEIVKELTRRRWNEKRIAKELGMDADEVLRLKQVTGLMEMFADRDFSEAWEPSKE